MRSSSWQVKHEYYGLLNETTRTSIVYSPIQPLKSQVSGKAQAEMSLQATFSGKSHQMHRTLKRTFARL